MLPMLLRITRSRDANTAYFSRIISKSQTSVSTTLDRKARQMKSELVELHLPGAHSASVSKPIKAPGQLAVRGYTFTTVRGARR